MSPALQDRFRGCLLGGAVGDALGAPVEFLRWDEISARFGPSGIRDYVPAYGRLGAITDDTQMTLYTADGLLRAYHRANTKGICNTVSVVSHAYLRWLQTQGEDTAVGIHTTPGWLDSISELRACRAPGNTCISALRKLDHYTDQPARNDSKGCGGVMRVAPCGLMFAHQPDATADAFALGKDCAALTHGHPTGQLAAAVMAALIQQLAHGVDRKAALAKARRLLCAQPDHAETLAAIEAAEALATSGKTPCAKTIHQLGGGWVAEEALAIALYCALVASDFEMGVILAVNHDGDSDSTGAIVGNLLGAMLGAAAIPTRWLGLIELRDVLMQVADDLCDHAKPELDPDNWDSSQADGFWERYPPC